MTNRRRVVGAAAALAAGGVAGCLGGGGSARANASVGVPAANYPFAFRSRCCEWEADPLEGFDVALVEALADRLAAPLSTTASGPDPLAELRDGTVRLLAPGAPLPATTPDGLTAVGPTIRGYLTVVADADGPSPGPGVAALDDRDLLAPAAPGRDRAVERLRSVAPGARVSLAADLATARDAFAAGDADGLVVDQVTADRLVRDGRGDLVRDGDAAVDAAGYDTPYLALAEQRYGYLFRAGDDAAARVAAALEAVRDGAEYRSLRDDYFRRDGRPRPR